MKRIFLLIYLTNAFTYSQIKYENKLNDFGLSEDVIKTVEEDYKLILFSNVKPTEQHKLDKRRVKLFNSNGLLVIDSVIRGQKYYQKEHSLYYYNKNNLLKKIFQHRNRGSLTETTNFYNSDNKLIRQNENKETEYTLTYSNKKLINKSMLRYDYNGESKKIYSFDYQYNEADSLSNVIYQNFAFNEKEHLRFEYNKQLKNTIKLTYRNNKIRDSIVSTSIYHINGKLVELNEKKYNIAGELTKEIHQKFNDYGLKIFSDIKYGSTSIQEKSEYDKNQNLILELTIYNGKPSQKNIYTYKYDNKGNWLIKCLKQRDFNFLKQTKPEPIITTKRRIYYNDDSISKKITREEALCFCEPNYKKRLEEFIKKEKKSNTKPIIIREVEEHK